MQWFRNSSGKIILALATVLVLLCSVCGSDVSADSRARTVKAGFFDYAGYHAKDKDNQHVGYSEDFFCMMQRYTKLHYEYVDSEMSWIELFDALEQGDIDLLSPVRWTPERAQSFDFTHSIGRNYTQLTSRNSDLRFAVHNNDYSSLNGARIALLKDSCHNKNLEHLAQQYHFSYVPVVYGKADELAEALQKGEVDLIVSSSLRKTKDERIITRFAPEEFYAVVRKGDKELLDELNYGIEQMDINEGDWRNNLYYKNYLRGNNKMLSFSQRELDYIADVKAGRKEITATVRTDLNPFVYQKDGEAAGIVPEYFAYLMQMAGLPYKLIMPKSNVEYQQWLREGRVDVFVSSFADEAAHNKYGIATESYLRLNISRVTRKDFSGEIKSIAGLPVNAKKHIHMERDIAVNVKWINKPTRDEALQAVSSGQADACYVYSNMVDKYIRQHPDCNLVYTPLTNPTDEFHVIVAPRADNELASIINKCIKVDNGRELDELVKKHMEYGSGKFNLKQFLADNPLYILVCMLMLIAAGYIFYLNMVMRKGAQQLAAERLQYAEKLQQQNKQLEVSMEAAQKANIAKQQFLFNMSHDIRTPMNAILGFTDLSLHNLENKVKLEDYLQKIRRSGDNLLSLINNVLEMARIETGNQQVHEEVCNVKDLLDSITIPFEVDIKAKKLNFTVENKVQHQELWLDKTLIRQIIVNLLSNAIKYTPEGGMIHYKVEELPDEREGYCLIRATVQDNGSGISKEFLPHIFDQFEREQTSTTNKIIGSGLGMAIVKRMIEILDADIKIDSELGKGTTVCCTFEHRIAAKQEGRQEAAQQRITHKQLAGKRILLAEDNDLNAEIAMTVMENVGLAVERAKDGVECVEMLKAAAAHSYDLVLMDVQMPRLNGYEATMRIRKLEDAAKREIPIVAMTANAFAEDKQKALEAGMNDFLPKPVDVQKLLAVLAKLLP